MKKTIYSKPTHKRPKGETRLREWLDSTGMSAFALAKEIGKHPSHVNYWANGQQIPTLIDAFKIEKLTAGVVTVESWLETDLGKMAWNNNVIRKDKNV